MCYQKMPHCWLGLRHSRPCYNSGKSDLDEVMQMGGKKATEAELRALVAQDSSILPALEAALYEPESPPNDLNPYEKGSWEHQNECRTSAKVGHFWTGN